MKSTIARRQTTTKLASRYFPVRDRTPRRIQNRENGKNTTRKTVLITGATSGFGAAMARRFAQAGWGVIATGRRAERLHALVDELGTETTTAASFDVRDVDATNAALSSLPEAFRGIAVLINNA